MGLVILSLLLAILAFIYYNFYHKLKGLPPGPLPLPVLGNLLAFAKYGSFEQALLKWRRQYGPVFTYWLGNLPVVAITDYQKIMDTAVRDGDNYADRQTFPFEHTFRGDPIHGVISSSGYLWREQRRFALHTLRDFGLGKNLMQERILDELTAMFGKLDAKLGDELAKELDLPEAIDLAIGSIINSLLFGYRLDGEKEQEFWEIKHMLEEHMRKFADPLLMLWVCYPELLDPFPPFKQMAQGVRERLGRFFGFFEKRILEHQRELALGMESHSEPKDYVEAFLREMGRKEEEGEQGHYFSIEQLSNMCFDLWIAGQETTSNMLSWVIAFLLNNPECLGQVYAELDLAIGSERLIQVGDRQQLPYINAVINESLRLSNIVAMNIRRVLSKDVILDGFNLPKGTCIVPEISAVLYDENYFPEPEKFKPDRFLDSEGKPKRCDQLIPFSVGKRQCLGESLARMELFLFTANIFNRYKISLGKELPSLERKNAPIVKCPPFRCQMEKRK